MQPKWSKWRWSREFYHWQLKRTKPFEDLSKSGTVVPALPSSWNPNGQFRNKHRQYVGYVGKCGIPRKLAIWQYCTVYSVKGILGLPYFQTKPCSGSKTVKWNQENTFLSQQVNRCKHVGEAECCVENGRYPLVLSNMAGWDIIYKDLALSSSSWENHLSMGNVSLPWLITGGYQMVSPIYGQSMANFSGTKSE